MDIIETLKVEAHQLAGCDEGMAQLGAAHNKQDMVKIFFDRIDFCLAKDFPSPQFIKAHFSQEAAAEHIYVDRAPLELHKPWRAVLLGSCDATLMANDYAVCRLYVKHQSRLHVVATEQAFVMIDALDQSIITIDCHDGAKVVVYLYAQAQASKMPGCNASVKIVHKNMDSYEL